MIGLLSIISLGFFLGMRHATDPDHVIAVSTIVSRHRSLGHAAVIGMLWGIGHTATIMLVGGGIILFGWVIPVRLGLSMELSVGLMLILLGILNLTGLLQWITNLALLPDSIHQEALGRHQHPHPCASESHSPEAGHGTLSWFDRHCSRLGAYQVARPLIVGLVHGLAGSAAVALLVLTSIHKPEWAILYLGIFGIGTIAGMALITGALALPFAYASGRMARLHHGLRIASGLASVAFGLFLVYRIGFVNGLLTAHPQWTPH